MPAPSNPFKAALAAQTPQIGCWLSMGEAASAEIMGTCGFDWLVIDGEHGPNDLRSIRDQLMALERSESHPVVRIPVGETWMVKQVFDAGAQTVLVPLVETAAEAGAMARACRYPPQGVRGVGSSAARASRFAQIPDYLATANDEVCMLVQVETRKGMDNIEEIAAVDGVDGVFIGPADLSADMGHLGNAAHPDVKAAIAGGIARIREAGKAPGILMMDLQGAQEALGYGAVFVAVGIDVTLLAKAARALAAQARALVD
ncbi:2,4-dihydroxyhept-2-enedioate aldolase [Salinihabitans flavidus]|uniref:Hydroxypyruvate/pyruvate aldolase n=1 Tax=Salinihabitans flavidus TaxID=569882 RepID=A0A1H8SS85_9RHOB|nr:HpcH/HpaI aldolase/citrate lyase family protein [Salinihabitans flavidus]SEO81435.1 2,4-dihydroxyhept-2-enedioate aldolase [Salinihabitans flavidus]